MFYRTDDVGTDLFEEGGRCRQSGAGLRVGAEGMGGAEGGGGQVLVGAGAGQDGADACVRVDEIALAAGGFVAAAQEETLLFEEADGMGDGGGADLEVLCEVGCGATAGFGGEQADEYACGGTR